MTGDSWFDSGRPAALRQAFDFGEGYAFAGLYDIWKNNTGEIHESFSVPHYQSIDSSVRGSECMAARSAKEALVGSCK